MIVREFNIDELHLEYFVGINQIKMDLDKVLDFSKTDDKEKTLDQFFNLIEEIQNKYENSVIQFFKDKHVLNQDHIFTACYYLQKAFLQKYNISNKKNIELLLYLTTNRQISKSIEAFGIDISDLAKNNLTYCIISPVNNLNNINNEVLRILNAEELELNINNQSHPKLNSIKEFFKISENQLLPILRSSGIKTKKSEFSLNSMFSAIYDLICEKMALLSLEKTKVE
ncbi:MAG: KEOPS complex subunit Cgi121 [Candidatus Hodarchaeota archaeon]